MKNMLQHVSSCGDLKNKYKQEKQKEKKIATVDMGRKSHSNGMCFSDQKKRGEARKTERKTAFDCRDRGFGHVAK